jgi:hypothetical protein
MNLRQRQPRETDPGFLTFLRGKPCCVCGCAPPVQAAHIRMGCLTLSKRSTGMGERPSDRYACPLCPTCHLDGPGAQHKGAEEAFWRRTGIDPYAIAAALYATYRAGHATNRGSNPSKRNFMHPRGVSRLKRDVDSGRKSKVSSQGFPPDNASLAPKRPSQVKRATDSGVKVRRPKRKWASQPLRSASRWPARGTRKIENRRNP